MMMKIALKILSLSLFFGTIALAVASWFVPGLLPVVHAQAKIAAQFPGQASSAAGGEAPGAFINAFYVWALSISGVLAFGIIVYGGVKYMVSWGNPSGESDAKEWIKSALLGILLLASAYFILSIINPNLVSLGLPGLTSVTAVAPPQSSQNYSYSPTSSCMPLSSGPCSVSNLVPASSGGQGCFTTNVAIVSGICRRESGGYAANESKSDSCLAPTGTALLPVSIGLFQINITDSWTQPVTVNGKSYNCASAFNGSAVSCSGSGACTTGHNQTGQQCRVINMAVYNACVSAAQQALPNIQVACRLSNNGGNLSPWKADQQACGF